MQVSRAATLDTASNATAITVSHLVDKREQSFGTWLSCREKFIGLSGRVFGIRVGQAPHKGVRGLPAGPIIGTVSGSPIRRVADSQVCDRNFPIHLSV